MGNKQFTKCIRKRSYRVGDAFATAKRLGDGVEPYKCPHCRMWHVGHPTGIDIKSAWFGARRVVA